MSWTAAAWLQAGLLVVALAVSYRPLGDYMARVFTSAKHWRVERVLYRVMGVDPDADQHWPATCAACSRSPLVRCCSSTRSSGCRTTCCCRSGFPRCRRTRRATRPRPSSPTPTGSRTPASRRMGHLVQMAGLAVQNFVSAAVGIVVAVALIRGFARSRDRPARQLLGRPDPGTLRMLLPLAFVVRDRCWSRRRRAELLTAPHDVTTLAGGQQAIPGGPVASQEAIKELGTNGGGFYNANSAHPFENPNRVHQPGPRSSCCWSSRSRCRAPSARWSATTGRATRSSA